MTKFYYLTKRNMLLYFRDKSAVFASLLSMLIVIGLMLFFLGDMNIRNITEGLSKIPGHDTSRDHDNAKLLLLSWTAAGIMPINSLMVTLSVLSSIIRDKNSGRINSIYTAPVSRTVITLSYICAACISSIIICSATLAVSEIYICAKGFSGYTFNEHLQIIGMILVNSFTYSALMYICASLIKSEGAWSAVGTVVGTLSGFFGGIYLPIGSMSKGLADVICCSPVIYGTSMFRKVMTDTIISNTFSDAPENVIMSYKNSMGIELEAFGNNISPAECVIIVIGFGLLFTVTGVILTRYMKRRDR